MGIFKRSRDKPEKRAVDGKMQDFIKGVDVDDSGGVSSGVSVDEMKSMQTSAVYACVRLISETVASLPCFLYKRKKRTRSKPGNIRSMRFCTICQILK